jgi:hypothetical protein
MTITEAMHSRHAVRSYVLRPLKEETAAALRTEIDRCNRESGLHIRLITGEPEAFSTAFGRGGRAFPACPTILCWRARSRDLEERAGYYGQRLALYAQTLGLNTCWAAGSFRRGKVPRGAGRNAGVRHRRGLRRHGGASPRQPVGGQRVPHRPPHSRRGSGWAWRRRCWRPPPETARIFN